MTRTGQNFLSTLAARRGVVAFHKAARRPRRIRIAPQRQPDAIRRTYNDALQRLVAAAAERVRRALYPHGPALVAEAARLHGDALILTLDSPASTASKIFGDLARDFFGEFTNERIASVVKGFGSEISDFQRREIASQFEKVIGFDPFRLGEPWLPTRIENFTAENVSLVKSIPERMFGELEAGLIRDLRGGARWEEIAPAIEARFGVSSSRAELIARDQAGKFFGELNHARQTDVGVARYVWRTARDNRVRDSHEVLEGTAHAWDDPPAETGHPGEDINCRCQAEPDLSDLLASIEGEDGGKSAGAARTEPAPEPEPVAAPEFPAPEPLAEPAPEPEPISPPTTATEVYDRMQTIAPEVFGEEFMSTGLKLDADLGGANGQHDWAGEVRLSDYVSMMLRDSLRMIERGETLGRADVAPLKTLLHEEIHSLGQFKTPVPTDAQGRWAKYTEAMREYGTPVGRVLEEGTTELMAQREIAGVLERMGVKLEESARIPGYVRKGASFSATADVSYVGEVHGVDTLCRLAVGAPLHGDMTPEAIAVLRKLSYGWAQGERVTNIATMLAESVTNATDAIADQRFDLVRDFLIGPFARTPGAADDILKILGAPDSAALTRVRAELLPVAPVGRF